MSQSSSIRCTVLTNCTNFPSEKENKTIPKSIIKARSLSNSTSKRPTSIQKISKNPNNTGASSKENNQRLKHVTCENLAFQKQNEELRNNEKKSIKYETEECGKRQVDYVVNKDLSVTKSSKNKENMKFVACPPKVLYKDPFKPVYNQHILKLSPFNLNADKRVAERKKFDKLLKEKEEDMRKEIEMREKIQREQKKREEIEYRARLVHHAKPVPNMSKPFLPQKSDAPLTIPKTPTRTRKTKY